LTALIAFVWGSWGYLTTLQKGVLLLITKGEVIGMKSILITALVIILLTIPTACAAPSETPVTTPSPATTPSPIPTSTKQITVYDGPIILDLLTILPPYFMKLDAADEELSKEDMGIYDENVCETQVFLSEEPYQLIYCLLQVDKSRIAQSGFDAMIRDEQQMKAFVVEMLKAGAEEEGLEIEVPEIQITYPNISDSAVLVEGQMESYGLMFGFDFLWFRDKSAHIFLYSLYYSVERESLVPIADAIEDRLTEYSH